METRRDKQAANAGVYAFFQLSNMCDKAKWMVKNTGA